MLSLKTEIKIQTATTPLSRFIWETLIDSPTVFLYSTALSACAMTVSLYILASLVQEVHDERDRYQVPRAQTLPKELTTAVTMKYSIALLCYRALPFIFRIYKYVSYHPAVDESRDGPEEADTR